MGCTASRPETLLSGALEGSASYLPSSTRSIGTPLVHHPPTWEGDSNHLVSLTSTTYGSLILVDRRPSSSAAAAGQSHSPDSVINTWELMEGLDDEDADFNSKLNSWNQIRPADARKVINSRTNSLPLDSVSELSDSFVLVEKPHEITQERSSNFNSNSHSSSKPLWKHLSEESLLSKMDPSVAATYHRALSSRQLGIPTPSVNPRSAVSSPVLSRYHSVPSSPLVSTPSDNSVCQIPTCDDKIVLYFTSLRGIRKTYDDCCLVRLMLRGLRVAVDEKDISMDSAYRKELKDALGEKPVSLPQVFIRGKHVGGAEEMKQLNEAGELARLVEGFPALKDFGFVCEGCGDARFVPCKSCNGSRKVFKEEEGRTRRCPDCNENGLIRCPACRVHE